MEFSVKDLALSQRRVNDGVIILRQVVALFDKRNLNELYEFAIANELLGDALSLTSRLDEAHGSYAIARSYFERMEAQLLVERLDRKIVEIPLEQPPGSGPT